MLNLEAAMRGILSIRAEIIMRKTSGSLILATVFFVLGMTTSALGAAQQAKPFDGTTLPQQVLDVYKSGLPFKQYISETIKNSASLESIKLDLGNANIQCGGEGADVRTNKVICNPAISFMNQTCIIDPAISRNCEQTYIKEYLHAQNLNETQQSKFSYIFLANSAAMNHPGSPIEELLKLTRGIK
jgi:hypothetical protein